MPFHHVSGSGRAHNAFPPPFPNPTWITTAYAQQTGTFSVEYDVIPYDTTINFLTALCSVSSPTAFTDLACIVRFFSGVVDARNGGAYEAVSVLNFSANVYYHVRIDADVSNHTYSAYVTPAGSAEVTIANNYAFRTEQVSVTDLDFFTRVNNDSSDAFVIGFSISADINRSPAAAQISFSSVAPSIPNITLSPASANLAITTTAPSFGGDEAVPTITIHATTSTFASAVSSAVNGDVIGLAAGNYGTWTGTNKAITIVPEAGVSPVIALALSTSASNFTIDGGHTEIHNSTNGMVRETSFTSAGITMGPCTMLGQSTVGARNITIKRVWMNPATGFFGFWEIDTYGDRTTNLNFVFDRCYFHDCIVATPQDGEASIRVDAKGLLVKNCYFYNNNLDGVKLNGGTNHIVQDCEFRSIDPKGSEAHTDCVQFYGGTSSTVTRCFVYDFEQGLTQFSDEGSGQYIGDNQTITDNVVDCGPYGAPHWISVMSDGPNGSLVEHNTVVGIGYGGTLLANLAFGSKTGTPASKSYVRNNIGRIEPNSDVVGANLSQNTNNMFSGASSPNINGSPTFVGGSNPTTWQGYKLTAGSSGHAAGTDGLDVGIRVS